MFCNALRSQGHVTCNDVSRPTALVFQCSYVADWPTGSWRPWVPIPTLGTGTETRIVEDNEPNIRTFPVLEPSYRGCLSPRSLRLPCRWTLSSRRWFWRSPRTDRSDDRPDATDLTLVLSPPMPVTRDVGSWRIEFIESVYR